MLTLNSATQKTYKLTSVWYLLAYLTLTQSLLIKVQQFSDSEGTTSNMKIGFNDLENICNNIHSVFHNESPTPIL